MTNQLKEIFDSEYSKNKLIDFSVKTEKIYDYFNYDFILKNIEVNSKKYNGGKVWVNEKYTNQPISNLTILRFKLLYPTIISKIVNTNLENFNTIFSKIIDIYFETNYNSIKNYINMAYGCLGNLNSIIYADNIDIVTYYSKRMVTDIIDEFNSHIVNVDTDEIYFRNFDEIKHRFEQYYNKINIYELDYNTEQSKFGLFYREKKYLFEQNGNIKVKGLNRFHKDGVNRGGFVYL